MLKLNGSNRILFKEEDSITYDFPRSKYFQLEKQNLSNLETFRKISLV